MTLRQMITERPAVGGAVALALLACTAVMWALSGRNGEVAPFQQAWFYDVDSGALFTAQNRRPPVPAPSGGEGVRAVIFTCGACDPANLTPSYLETFTPEAIAVLTQPADTASPEAIDAANSAGRLIAPPPSQPGAELQWFASNTPAGAAVAARAQVACPKPGQRPTLCMP